MENFWVCIEVVDLENDEALTQRAHYDGLFV